MQLTIPTSLNEITLDQYIRYMRATKLPDYDDLTDYFVKVCVFCDLSFDEVNKIPVKEVKEIAHIITETLNITPKFIQRFTYDGIEYGFIPNLDDMSPGEYIDLVSEIPNTELYLNEFERFPKAMSILFRKINNKFGNLYEIEKYTAKNESVDLMLNTPVEIILGALVFFWNLKTELLKATADYLEQDLSLQPLGVNGGGISLYIRSQVEFIQR